MSRPPRLLFVTLTSDPGSDRIVAAMGRLGAECAILGDAGAFAARSRFAKVRFALPRWARYLPQALSFAPRLAAIAGDWGPDLVIPLDELAGRALRDRRLYRDAGAELRGLIERSLGAPAHFDTICSRERFIAMAQRLGVRTPRQRAALDLAAATSAAAALGYPVVLKREQTCGGAGVAIVPDAQGLRRAYRRAWRRASAKRLVGWIPGFGAPEGADLTLQQFVPGALAFRAVACAEGVVLEGVSFQAEFKDPGDTRGSAALRHIEQPEMAEAARTVVAALQCSGFVAFDFLLSADKAAHLIEMNARPIASGHLGRLFGHDLYAAMLAHLGATPARLPAAVAPPRAIALFPQELDRNPGSALVDAPGVLHDLPADDPGLIEAYLAWLEARHPDQRQALRRRLLADRSLPASRVSELAPRA